MGDLQKHPLKECWLTAGKRVWKAAGEGQYNGVSWERVWLAAGTLNSSSPQGYILFQVQLVIPTWYAVVMLKVLYDSISMTFGGQHWHQVSLSDKEDRVLTPDMEIQCQCHCRSVYSPGPINVGAPASVGTW